MKLLPLIGIITALSGCASPANLSHTQSYPKNQSIQQIVDDQVKSAKTSLRPKAIVVVVAEPKTGKILAISGYEKGSTSANLGSNSSLAGKLLFEPASTFKPVAAVAALENGDISPETKIFCENGSFIHEGKFIRDVHPLGCLTFDEILAKSSNIGTSKMVLGLHDKVYYDYVKKFGFGEKSGISIPREVPGIVSPPSQWQTLNKVRMAIGHGIGVTPIQLTMAYCALANGGLLMKPIVGNEKPHVVRRVCSEKTADLVKSALQASVSDEGTAPLAQVEAVTVGGKTGTSQAISSKGGYLAGQYQAMFVGFFPVEDPKYVITVVVDDADLPAEKTYGGLVAAPIFAAIGGKILKLK